RRRGDRFVEDARAIEAARTVSRQQAFQRDPPPQIRIGRQEDLAHAALPDAIDEDVLADARTGDETFRSASIRSLTCGELSCRELGVVEERQNLPAQFRSVAAGASDICLPLGGRQLHRLADDLFGPLPGSWLHRWFRRCPLPAAMLLVEL